MLGRNLLVGRAVEGGRLTLFNRQLSLRSPATAAAVESRVDSRAEMADVLAQRFGLAVDAADLDAVMAVLDAGAGA
jgi:arylamine N-acetyltransferase